MYENPKIPEGINNPKENPLKEFFTLAAGVFGTLAITIWLLLTFIAYWAPYVPFSWEDGWIDTNVIIEEISDAQPATSTEQLETQKYLQTLADEILIISKADPDISITVHYLEGDMVNAFATLGGNIYIFSGLLKSLTSENTVFMLLSHEIAHVVHRDPIVALFQELGLSAALGLITGLSDTGGIEQSIQTTRNLTAFSYSRSQESAADKAALDWVNKRYGHIQGAIELFHHLEQEITHTEGVSSKLPDFFSTHPKTSDRIKKLKKIAEDNTWSFEGELTPLEH